MVHHTPGSSSSSMSGFCTGRGTLCDRALRCIFCGAPASSSDKAVGAAESRRLWLWKPPMKGSGRSPPEYLDGLRGGGAMDGASKLRPACSQPALKTSSTCLHCILHQNNEAVSVNDIKPACAGLQILSAEGSERFLGPLLGKSSHAMQGGQKDLPWHHPLLMSGPMLRAITAMQWDASLTLQISAGDPDCFCDAINEVTGPRYQNANKHFGNCDNEDNGRIPQIAWRCI